MSKWNELKRLAEAQPNKEWSRAAEGRLSCSSGLRMYGVTGPQCVSDFEDWGFTRESASFIAAANPAAILELIAENERLRTGVVGDFDLDAWLDWTKEADQLRAENERLAIDLKLAISLNGDFIAMLGEVSR